MAFDWFTWTMVAVFLIVMLVMDKPVRQAKKQRAYHQQSQGAPKNCVIQWTQREMLERSLEKLRAAGVIVTAAAAAIPDVDPVLSAVEKIAEKTREILEVEQVERRAMYKEWVANCARVEELSKKEKEKNEERERPTAPKGKVIYLAS